MKEILEITPILLYMIVGVISTVMAFKNLFSTKFLPFQEKAANKPWDEIDNPLKLVILTLLRLAGLGFLIISILLLVFPVINYFIPNEFYKYSIPIVALIFCTGLFVINYSLYKNTKADTPWKGSLYAMLAIIVGIIMQKMQF
ncbi:MAG TPA: hypothetical protein VIK14_05225 [Ignavibacteria bacterium]